MSKWVYTFGAGKAEGGAKDKNLLGGKGANLAEMSSLGIPVPPGFTISTECCTFFYENNNTYPPDLKEQVEAGVKQIEEIMGGKFGATEGPLVLVSVRSGARASMPGMMDTVLNLGLNDQSVRNLVAQTGDERFAYDSYRRFIQMYSDVVLDIGKDNFEHLLEHMKDKLGKHLDVELTAAEWKVLVEEYKQEVKKRLGRDFPQDPWEQLWGGVGAVFGSWMNKRANTYRRLNNIPDHWGTAVNVQAMVFGNMGEDCATGVSLHAQPVDRREPVLRRVSGQRPGRGRRRRHPHAAVPVDRREEDRRLRLPSMEEVLPPLYHELVAIRERLEQHYHDMQDMEFTIESKQAVHAADPQRQAHGGAPRVRIAVEMCEEGLIDKAEAVRRVEPAQLDQLLHPMLDPKAKKEVLAKGLPASPGAASGQIVFSADEAEAWVEGRQEGHPGAHRDQPGGHRRHARRRGHPDHPRRHDQSTRRWSRAAWASRCVAGAGELKVDYAAKTLTAGGKVLKEGEVITLDGTAGRGPRRRGAEDPAGD